MDTWTCVCKGIYNNRLLSAAYRRPPTQRSNDLEKAVKQMATQAISMLITVYKDFRKLGHMFFSNS